jgi:hypothetical protein
MLSLFLAMWCTGIVLKAVAALRMARNGLARRYQVTWTYLFLCVAQSSALFMLRHNSQTYSAVNWHTTWLLLIAEGLAVTEVFWVVSERVPRFRLFGVFFLGTLTLIAGLAAWWTAFVGVPIAPTGRDLPMFVQRLVWLTMLVQRFASVVLVLVLATTRVLLPRSPYLPVRESAIRAANIFVVDTAFGITSAAVALVMGIRNPVSAALPLAAGIVTGALWLLYLTPGSDREPGAPYTPEELDRLYKESETEVREAWDDLERDLRA